ncbi:MAG: Fe-S-containing hydro-lyase [Clostridia bacterium]|nr:Fe-S-containing hydro-lyase [Clostridia bacterium]
MELKLHTSEVEKIKNLKAGDMILLSGEIYTARDAAHKRMTETLEKGEELPFDIKDKIIYYAGPTPAKPGEVIGSCGPTSSYRMDRYAPVLLDLGQLGMIGKGIRKQPVIDAMKRNQSVYFAAIGGAGALISKSITAAEIVCYEDLGTEAVRKLTVKDLALTVVIDKDGNNLYDR